jgi:PRD1 phage membrane DNA delivery
MGDTGSKVAAIVGGIIVVAIIAVLVSQNAQTPSVIGAAGQAFGSVLQVAVSPVTGGSNNMGLPFNVSNLFGGQYGSGGGNLGF